MFFLKGTRDKGLGIRNVAPYLIACFLFLFQGAFAQAPQCGPYAKFYAKDSVKVITFGASTVQGYPGPYNFQNPLSSFLNTCYANKIIEITNYGIPGETTTKGLARFDAAIKGKTGFLLILMGANDAVELADGKLQLAVTVDNMSQMIRRAHAEGLDVILGTLQYFREIPGNSPEARLARRRNFFIDVINNNYKRLARNFQIKLADINAAIAKNNTLYVDGIHPNARGYHIIALSWFDAINQEVEENYLEPGITQNFPNPSTGVTKIGIALPASTRVLIKVFGISGKMYKVALDDYKNAGYYEVEIQTSDLEAGVYILQVQILGKHYVRKMLVAN